MGDDKLGDVNLDAFQKAIDNQWDRSPGMTIFTRFGQDVIKDNLSENLSSESVVSHFFISHNTGVIRPVEQS